MPLGADHIDVLLGLAAFVALILANAFFVAAEFALLAADRDRIEQLVEEGRRGAGSMLAGIKTLSFQLSGAQLGITVTSLLVGFLIEASLGARLEPAVKALGLPESSTLAIAIVVALVLATAIQMVVGEVLPKNLAIARPEQVGALTVPTIRWVNALGKPLIVFLNAAANRTVRLFGIEPREELASARTLEEFEALIRSSLHHGSLDAQEAALLERSIDFGEKTAADAMIPRTSVVSLDEDDPVSHLVDVAVSSGHSRFPVSGHERDEVIGLAHVKDTYRIPPHERASTTLARLVRPPLVVPESIPLRDLLVKIRADRKQMAVVLDEFGDTAGIVTLEDLLEEIVGEIEDEYDEPLVETPSPKGVFVVSGTLHPGEVAESTGFEMPEGDYETLAGFLLSLFDRIPAPGDHLSFEEWELKVIEMDGRRISRVLMVAPPPPPDEVAP